MNARNRTLKVMIVAVLTIAMSAATIGSAGAYPDPDAKASETETAETITVQPATPCVGGFAGTFPCNNVDLMAYMPLADIGGSSANDIWGWTDPNTGNEYAIIGRVNGTSFIDITDPVNPVYLGELPAHSSPSSWRDIKVYQDHAFIVSEASGHGMQIFDLTQLAGVVSPPVTFSETAHYNSNSAAHNVAINEDTGFAYIVGASGLNSCLGGLHMVDISTPTSPSFVGCYLADGYSHDAQCVIYNGADTAHVGKEICIGSNEDTVTIVDVTNKAAPVQLSRTGYSGSRYTHQGWLTEDHNHFLLDDELDETNVGHNTRTRIWDVTDLDAPVLTGSFTNTTAAIDHNQYILGDFSYQANYRAGLRILDISGIASATLSEVAFFDIYPADDSANFNGAWSVYPYFDSGNVIVSGIEQGLFVLRPNLSVTDNPPTITITDPLDGGTVSGTYAVTADALDDNGVSQVRFFAGGTTIGIDNTAPYTVNWDTTSNADGAIFLTAIATDTAGQRTPHRINVTVANGGTPTMHSGDLDGLSQLAGTGWRARVVVAAHDASDSPVAGATVTGTWSAGATGSASCVTNAAGRCAIRKAGISSASTSVTFTVDGISQGGLVYTAGDNHDPDGDSTGTVIVIARP